MTTILEPDNAARQRLLDEWRTNFELHRFHDGLKHQRITHILTLETALLALAGLLAKEFFVDRSARMPPVATIFLSIGILICAAIGYSLSSTYRSMNSRARAYVEVVKTRLMLLEEEWNQTQSGPELSTFTEQWLLFRQPPDSSILAKYLAIRDLGQQEILPERLAGPPAYVGEDHLFRVFQITWAAVSVGAVGILVVSTVALF